MALHKWLGSNELGEVRLVRPLKYHGKVYLFRQNGVPFRAFIGSNNLSAIKPEASNLRQYEICVSIENEAELSELSIHMDKLKSLALSTPINETTGLTLIREVNRSLEDVDTVERVPQSQVDLLHNHKTDISFELPIKVPAFVERFMDDRKHYTKSNINTSYAAPRNARKSRNWFEAQFTVDKEHSQKTGYPQKNTPFFVITDDGYVFKAHTTSDHNKQLSAVGDELIMGRWIKGRLVAAGLVAPVNNTQRDTERLGMITQEMLAAYGCNTIILTKTDQHKADSDGNLLDVWLLTFEAGVHRQGDRE
jgi:hypothetical protein